MGTAVVLILLAAAIFFAGRYLWRQRKTGGCPGGCAGCSGECGRKAPSSDKKA